jgi:hypothetical protein
MHQQSTQLNAAGPSAPLILANDDRIFLPGDGQAYFSNPLLPSLLATPSPGAVLTYQIEVTNDNVFAPGYNPATGNWNIFTDGQIQIAGQQGPLNLTLGVAVMAIRANITSYTSGSLNVALCKI